MLRNARREEGVETYRVGSFVIVADASSMRQGSRGGPVLQHANVGVRRCVRGVSTQGSQTERAQTESCAQTEVMVCVEAEERDSLGGGKEEAAHEPVLQHASVRVPCGDAETPVKESMTKEVGMWAKQAALKV